MIRPSFRQSRHRLLPRLALARRVAVVAACATLSACAAAPNPTAPAPAPVRQITQSAHCGLTGPGLLLVTTDDQLSKYLGLKGQNLATQQLRAVDLNQEVLLFVTLGEKPTAGYGVGLAAADLQRDTLRIRMESRTPPAGAVLAQVMTSPCAVLAVEPGRWNRVTVSGVAEAPMVLQP